MRKFFVFISLLGHGAQGNLIRHQKVLSSFGFSSKIIIQFFQLETERDFQVYPHTQDETFVSTKYMLIPNQECYPLP